MWSFFVLWALYLTTHSHQQESKNLLLMAIFFFCILWDPSPIHSCPIQLPCEPFWQAFYQIQYKHHLLFHSIWIHFHLICIALCPKAALQRSGFGLRSLISKQEVQKKLRDRMKERREMGTNLMLGEDYKLLQDFTCNTSCSQGGLARHESASWKCLSRMHFVGFLRGKGVLSPYVNQCDPELHLLQ